MKTPRYQRAACERDKIEREFRRLRDEKLGRKYLELDDALFRVPDGGVVQMTFPDGTSVPRWSNISMTIT